MLTEEQIQVIPEFTEDQPVTQAELAELIDTLNKVFRDYRIGMYEFNGAMKQREAVVKRAHERINLWIFLGGTAFLLILAILLFLILMLGKNLDLLSTQMTTLRNNSTLVTTEIGTLKQTLGDVKTQIAQLGGSEISSPVPDDSLHDLKNSLNHLEQSMGNMINNLDAIDRKLDSNSSHSKEPTYTPRYEERYRY
jgi:hypothetical protein